MIRTKVSVLIPVFNSEAYVGKAIRSVLAQSFSDFEVVVLDDGSEDGSARVARAFGDPRVRVYRREEHEGIAATRNHLLIAAKAPLIAWLDADDVMFPERLTKQVEYLEAHPDTALVACAFAEMDAQGQNLRQRSLPREHDVLSTRLLHAGSLPTSSVLMRRQAIDAAGGFDVELRYACEHDLFLRIAEKAKLAALRDTLVKCRVHVRSLAYTRRLQRRNCMDEARRRAVLRRWGKQILIHGQETPATPEYKVEATVESLDALEVVSADSDTSSSEATVETSVSLRPNVITQKIDGEEATEAAGTTAAETVAQAGDDESTVAATSTELDEVDESKLSKRARRRRRKAKKAATQSELAFQTAASSDASVSEEKPAEPAERGDASPAVAAKATSTESIIEETDGGGAEGSPSVEPGDEAPLAAAVAPRDPVVAVVLPVTGRKALEAVRSVLDQTLTDLTLAVVATEVDEGLERGLEILADDRVLLLEAEHCKRARALNLGVLGTRSRYVAYLSETCVYRPEHLDRLLEAAEGDRLGFIYSDLGLVTKGTSGSISVGCDFDAELLLKENYIPTEGVLHRRELLHEVGLFNEGLTEGMEWELWVYLTRSASTRRLAEVTVDRVVSAGRHSRSAPSPARVRRYLADKFNARRSAEEQAQAELATRQVVHEGDVMARAQELFRSGDWAGAAAEIVDAASRTFGALGQLFARRYPERELPGEGLFAAPAGPAVESRARTKASEPRVRDAMIANRQLASQAVASGSLPSSAVSAGALLISPLSTTRSVGEGLSLNGGWANETQQASLQLREEPQRAEPSGQAAVATHGASTTQSKSRTSTWLYMQSGLVGTGRGRGGRRATSATVGGATLATATGRIGNRRKAINTLVQNPPCPGCGEEKPGLAYRAGWYRVLDCQSCGVAFSHPQMEPGLANRFFSDRRGAPVPPSVRSVEDLAGTAFDRSRELGWVQRSVTGGKLIDVGCGWGYGLVQAAELGFEVVGSELSRPLARIARERFGVDVKEVDLRDIGLESSAADAVLAIHVLQHMVDFQGFIKESYRVLRSGGVLVGSVPNFDSYLRETLGRRWAWLDPESQPHHFRPRSLGRELENAGFSVELWTSEGQYGEETLLQQVSAGEAQSLARSGRGSELGFIATKRPVH